ncbi:Glyoxalase 3 [Vanrija pseudolonga]|uniref:Glyoxalase 3 n=1 Tax=Vanrija pseudolonga TaxID=143232 RepID=A0AAF0Y677_9TREE|nr:Glyoxalase 3 [Vanrija pseudolonga]
MPPSKVAIAIASSPASGGLNPEDVLRPFTAFRWAGLDVDFVSDNGTYSTLSPPTSPTTASFEERELLADPSSEFRAALARVKPATAATPAAYGIVLSAPGDGLAPKVLAAGGITVSVPPPTGSSPRTSLDVSRDGPAQTGADELRAELAGLSDATSKGVTVSGRSVVARSSRAGEAAALAAIQVYNSL